MITTGKVEEGLWIARGTGFCLCSMFWTSGS